MEDDLESDKRNSFYIFVQLLQYVRWSRRSTNADHRVRQTGQDITPDRQSLAVIQPHNITINS